MIPVQDFVKSLGIGVLKNLQLAVVDEDTHEVLPKAIPEIMHWINAGLTEIYSVYEVQDSVSVHIYESRTRYPLRSEYNMSEEEYHQFNPNYEHFLWKGYDEVFNDNVMQIMDVITHENIRLPMNDPSNMFSAFTPEYDVVQLPVNMLAGMVQVVYRAKHPLVDYEANTKIQLPPTLNDALANYVAAKIHSGMNGENAVQNASKYIGEYRSIMDNAVDNGVINRNDYQPSFSKFYKRGFK